MSGTGFFEPRYWSAEVREVTRSPRKRASSVMSASVSPSAR